MITDICQKCKSKISDKVSRYSWNAFGRPLCIDCQCEERSNNPKYPRKMSLYLNKEVRRNYKKEKKT